MLVHHRLISLQRIMGIRWLRNLSLLHTKSMQNHPETLGTLPPPPPSHRETPTGREGARRRERETPFFFSSEQAHVSIQPTPSGKLFLFWLNRFLTPRELLPERETELWFCQEVHWLQNNLSNIQMKLFLIHCYYSSKEIFPGAQSSRPAFEMEERYLPFG